MQRIVSEGGEGGIRTPGGCYTTPVFKTGAFDHSATSPKTPQPLTRQSLHRSGQTDKPTALAMVALMVALMVAVKVEKRGDRVLILTG